MAVNKKAAIVTSLGAFALASGYALYHASKAMSEVLMKRQERPDKRFTDLDGANFIQIKNRDGETLNGYYFNYQAPNTMLILHPYGLDAMDMVSYVDFFKTRMNCNFLLVDVYGHGGSDGEIYRLGGKDQDDLVDWLRYLDQHFDGNIILFGKEMGANIILNASGKLKEFEQIKAIISDGAYANVKDIISYRLQRDYYIFHFPFVILMRYIIKRKYGIDIHALDSVELVKQNQIPTMFIHTKKDCFVPLKQVFPLYNAARCKKELFVLKDEESLFQLDQSQGNDYLSVLDMFIKEYID